MMGFPNTKHFFPHLFRHLDFFSHNKNRLSRSFSSIFCDVVVIIGKWREMQIEETKIQRKNSKCRWTANKKSEKEMFVNILNSNHVICVIF